MGSCEGLVSCMFVVLVSQSTDLVVDLGRSELVVETLDDAVDCWGTNGCDWWRNGFGGSD